MVNILCVGKVDVIGGVYMVYNMVNCGGHIEVQDERGVFVLSADTIGEAIRELENLEERTSSP